MRIVICSVDHKGTLTQCLGIAQRIEGEGASGAVRIRRAGLVDRLRSRLGPLARFGAPRLILSCGTVGERRARKLADAHPGALWAHIEVPDPAARPPDLSFVSAHDWKPEFEARPGFLRIHGVPHEVRAEGIAAARSAARRRLGLGEGRAVACFMGGPSPAFRFDAVALASVQAALAALQAQGWTILASGSRRTPPAVIDALRPQLAAAPHRFFDGTGPNPYRDYLAAADAFLVSEDSITMTCEALATGRPVRWLRLEGAAGARLDKFRRFQRHFSDELGCMAFFDGSFDQALRTPPDDTGFAAQAILARLRASGTVDLAAAGPRHD